MARGFRIKVEGLGKLRVRSGKIGIAVFRGVQDALLAGAVLIEGDAKRACAVETGRLRASITHEKLGRGDVGETGVGYAVGTNVEYAPFVEFGTGRRGAASALVRSAREAMGGKGYAHGPRIGMPAQPFLFPAFEGRRKDIVDEVSKTVKDALETP